MVALAFVATVNAAAQSVNSTSDAPAKLAYSEKRQLRDKEYVENLGWNVLLGSAAFKGDLGWTNTTGSEIAGATGITEQLDEDETAYSVKFGYFGKPIIRDLYFLFGGQAAINKYRSMKSNTAWGTLKSKDWSRRLILEPISFDAYVGFGRTVTDDNSIENSVEDELQYYIGLKYKFPLACKLHQ